MTLDDVDKVDAQALQALLCCKRGETISKTQQDAFQCTCLYACSHAGCAEVEVGGAIAPNFGGQNKLCVAVNVVTRWARASRARLVARDVLERAAQHALGPSVAVKAAPEVSERRETLSSDNTYGEQSKKLMPCRTASCTEATPSS